MISRRAKTCDWRARTRATRPVESTVGRRAVDQGTAEDCIGWLPWTIESSPAATGVPPVTSSRLPAVEPVGETEPLPNRVRRRRVVVVARRGDRERDDRQPDKKTLPDHRYEAMA